MDRTARILFICLSVALAALTGWAESLDPARYDALVKLKQPQGLRR